MRFSRLLLLTPLSLFAAYTYSFSDTFSSGINSTYWFTNGTANGGSDGLVSTAANGGAVIYKGVIPDIDRRATCG